MDRTVLIVTAMDGAENLARALSREADAVVEIARSRRAAVARLRRDAVSAVLLDSALSDAESTSSEMVWQNAGSAVPLELALGSFGAGGIIRLLRSVLEGKRQAELLGRREAANAVSQELHSIITGLLLQSDLLLRERAITPTMASRVREVRELTDTLRKRLRSSDIDTSRGMGLA